MFTIEESIMKDSTLTPATKLVLSIIKHYSERNPSKNLAYETIADCTSLTKMTVIKCVKHLVENDWLLVAKNERGWNYYGIRDKH